MNLAAQNEDWNETVFSQLIRNFSNLEFTEVEIVKAEFEEKTILGSSLTRMIREFWAFAKKNFVLLTNNLSRTKIFYGNGISMESTYLSRWNLFKFFLLNRQLPTRKVFKSLIDVLENPNLRNWNLQGLKNDEFTSVLSYFIPKYLPRIYLESFNENKFRHQAETKSLNPKILVTGNDFSGNEAWAFWSADLMEKGSKIYIAQHGGFYGTALFCATQEHEISISDKFLSWGWTSSEQSRVTPAPAMKLLHNKNRRSLSKTGPVLLLGGTFPQYSYHLGSWPIGPQFHKYFDDQFSFVSTLSSEVKSNLNVRLHPADSNWRQGLRWKEYDERIKTENGSKPFSESLKGIRLSISTYNATTFLETFNRNIPTVIFWDQNYWELNDSARSHFDELIRAKILFTDPAECADHVNSIFNDTISWWQDNERQQVVRSFLHKFGYCPKFPMTKLAKIVNAN
jgi:putative transferase (TIGR04331 family)